MKNSRTAENAGRLAVDVRLAWMTMVVLAAGGCRPVAETRWQGYLEGDFVYVASPLAGRVETLAVARGDRVAAGATLFQLEATVERANQEQARQRLAQAEARRADLGKGARPSELAALEAQLAQARAATQLSTAELARITQLFSVQVVAADEYDRSRSRHEGNLAQVAELEARLDTARLGARVDALAAADAEVAAARAVLEQADWSVAEKAPVAPAAALVQDTLYRPGEVVAAGRPVVVLLPPENLHVRFFVPEAERATLAPGTAVKVSLSGSATPVTARVRFVSPQPEYTPPVLYNRENRAKLVFMIEADFAAGEAMELLPGQPVDVSR